MNSQVPTLSSARGCQRNTVTDHPPPKKQCILWKILGGNSALSQSPKNSKGH